MAGYDDEPKTKTRPEGTSGSGSGYGGEPPKRPPVVGLGMMPEGEPGDDPADITKRLGRRLRMARLARNLTQGQVGRQLFSASYVSAVERGQIRPSLGALERLAERLGVTVVQLLTDDETSEAPADQPAAEPTEPDDEPPLLYPESEEGDE